MHQIGIHSRAVEGGAAFHGSEDRLQRLGLGVPVRVDPEPAHPQASPYFILRAKGPNLHIHQPGQFPAQVIDMHPGAAINMGRVFVGQEEGFHKKDSAG